MTASVGGEYPMAAADGAFTAKQNRTLLMVLPVPLIIGPGLIFISLFGIAKTRQRLRHSAGRP